MYETSKFEQAVDESVNLLCKSCIDADWITSASEEDLLGVKSLLRIKETWMEMLKAKDKQIEVLIEKVSEMESKLDEISKKI